MAERGHEVTVVAAHPHYPEPAWGRRIKPARSTEDGVTVIRLPLWVGRDSALARMRQDASWSAALLAALPVLPRADARVVVSPCFPALADAIAAAKFGKAPWLLWVQDILPDGAIGTGLVDEDSLTIRLSRSLERSAYKSADHIAVISDRFEENLLAKDVPATKLSRIYNPATLPAAAKARSEFAEQPTALVMGNIGHSQGLDVVVREFESSERLAKLGAKLVITGTGVAAEDVRSAISTDRVEMRGVVSSEELMQLLSSASIGLVAQTAAIPEFNFPSKLMNYLASALPVVGFVSPQSEVGEVVRSTNTGWILDNTNPEGFGDDLAAILADRDSLIAASASAFSFAERNLTADALAQAFERALEPLLRR